MMKKAISENHEVLIPEGSFCGGNCADCIYYEPRNKDSNGRGYCNYYSTYYYPSERNGCFNVSR